MVKVHDASLLASCFSAQFSGINVWWVYIFFFRRGLREMMPHVLSSLALLAVHGTPVWWLAWARKMRMWVTRLSPSVVFWLSSTPLSMASSATGMIWKRFGIIPSITSFVSPLRNIPFSWPRLLLTLRLIARRWPKSCLRLLMPLPCM